MKVAIELEKAQVAELYGQMFLIRRFEENCDRLYRGGKIKGFLHLYIGEEAIAVGAISTLRDDDYVITHYREHGHALARGMDPKVVMAELMGKVTGSSRGKGGSMHLYDVSKGFMGGYAIVGGQLPIATGLALAIKYRRQDRAVLCFFGDGAVNEGEFHEALNLAAAWKLPVLFMLENNLYGMGTHVESTRGGGRDIYKSAAAYGIPASQIDGMDVVAVRQSTQEALERVRDGQGPILIEAMCYRFVGHSVQDPMFYRDKDEAQQWRRRDPIESFRELSLAEGLIEAEELDRIDESVEARIAEAIKFAEESDEPGLEVATENVYGP